jgi:hypothetical protein
VCLTIGCTSSNNIEVDRAHCTKLRDHLVDLRLQDATGVDRAAHRQAMKQALGDNFIASCTDRMTASQLTCGLVAKDLGAATSCSETASK